MAHYPKIQGGVATLNARVNSTNDSIILSFDPTLYYSCFIEYETFLYNSSTQAVIATRAGTIKISVPHDYSSYVDEYNIPFVENATEFRTNSNNIYDTTEYISFAVNYNGSNIVLIMYNNNQSYNAQINLQYKLIKFLITP